MKWESQVVDHMLILKRAGVTFDDSWTATLRRYPPRSRDVGYSPHLFDVDSPDEKGETHVQFFKRVCRQAWFNEKPELAHFGNDLIAFLAGDDEGTGIAQKRRVA